jgi:uncharacterized protein YcaQ
MMRRFPSRRQSVQYGRYLTFLEKNSALRRHILRQLRTRGPLKTSDFQDLSVTNYESTGWNVDRNVDRMLDYLWTKGKLMIVGRAGQQRVWDLAERWFPEWLPAERLSVQRATRRATERSIRALGVASKSEIWQYFTRWRYEDLPVVLAEFERKKKIFPVKIEGLKDKWFVHVDDLEHLEAIRNGAWEPRTTLLSPFDPLIADRKRLKKLWDFDFGIEIYVPKEKRKYGYYVLPILHGDQLIGRIDPTMDRKTNTLTINGVWTEPSAPKDKLTGTAVAQSVQDLAKFLGAKKINYGRKIPAAWKPALK